jgi:hypothetical protein
MEIALVVYKRAVDLMEAELGDELVALDPNAGDCFGFNGVATSVWRQLQQPRTFDQLRDSLLQEYDVDQQRCARELQELLDDLSARGLIVSAN